MHSPSLAPKRHILTVGLEDYFHVGAFNRLIQRGQWYRFETRFERNTIRVLDLLDRFDIKATFFVLGWIADRNPDLVKEVARRGHEIANRGFYHRSIREMSPQEFRNDLSRARDALEHATGQKVIGYRVAHQWFRSGDLWALNVLADEGYVYDSSVIPFLRDFASEPWRRFAHQHQYNDKLLWEFPFSTCKLLGYDLPIAGGNYFRQFPHALMKRLVRHWDRVYDAPFVMYFHVWELDPGQVRINAAPLLTRIRHYRNLDKLSWVLEDYFRTYSFGSIADYLGLSTARRETDLPPRPRPIEAISSSAFRAEPLVRFPAAARTPVAVVVPCYNEQLVLPYLANTLQSVEKHALENGYDFHFIFVDDASSDGTCDSLHRLFGSNPNCSIVRHEENQGVAAAILTGIRHAQAEIVCSMDCDCTYDPHELLNMIPLLTPGVDVVTASPYHPLGRVMNVPRWRLGLSKISSFLYRRVLSQKLHTYTSCFRVYRRSAVAELRLTHGNFLGVAETLGLMDLAGSKIVEYPATLEVRVLGHSKMKVARTIAGHLGLLARLLATRFRRFVRGTAANERLQGAINSIKSSGG